MCTSTLILLQFCCFEWFSPRGFHSEFHFLLFSFFILAWTVLILWFQMIFRCFHSSVWVATQPYMYGFHFLVSNVSFQLFLYSFVVFILIVFLLVTSIGCIWFHLISGLFKAIDNFVCNIFFSNNLLFNLFFVYLFTNIIFCYLVFALMLLTGTTCLDCFAVWLYMNLLLESLWHQTCLRSVPTWFLCIYQYPNKDDSTNSIVFVFYKIFLNYFIILNGQFY